MKWVIFTVLFLVGCTSIVLVDGSPAIIDAAICNQFSEEVKRSGCYDALSKYNQDHALCDNIVEADSDGFVQTADNCKAQLDQSTLFAKALWSEASPANIRNTVLTGNNTKEKAVSAMKVLKDSYNCKQKEICSVYPLPDDTFAIYCLCLN